MSEVVDQAKDLIKRYDESGFIHRDATMLLPGLVAECERLRKECDARQGFLCQIGDFLKERGRLDGSSAVVYSTQKAICDLEEELVRWQKIAQEERAARNYYEELPIHDDQYSWHDLPIEDITGTWFKKTFRKRAAKELEIATSDHIRDTTKMMLTAEQRAALEYAISSLEQCDSEPEDPIASGILQSMLSQSRPAWEITEGRRRAIELAQYGFRGFPQDTIDASIAVLQAMIEEAK